MTEANLVRDHSLGEGVYFAPSDYPRFWRRLLAFVIDCFLLLILFSVAAAIHGADPESNESHPLLLASLVTLTWIYFTVIKASRFRTLGYRLLGLRIVTLRGGKPSFFQMSIRKTFFVFGSLIEVFWVLAHRQWLGDQVVQLIVVRNRAKPIGSGRIRLYYVGVAGNMFLPCFEVRPHKKNQETID